MSLPVISLTADDYRRLTVDQLAGKACLHCATPIRRGVLSRPVGRLPGYDLLWECSPACQTEPVENFDGSDLEPATKGATR